jgi:hypothetical protein
LIRGAQAQTESLGTRLGEQVETTLTDPAYQQGGWDAFRLVPPPMSPSWSSGDFSIQLTATARVSYDDNVLQNNQQRVEDERFELEPAVRFRWAPKSAPAGTSAEVFYAPQLMWFANHSQFDTVNQYAGADLAGFFGKTTAELHYRTAFTSEPSMLQTARNLTHTESVILDANYELSGKTRLSSQTDLGYGDVSSGSQYWEGGSRLLMEYHVRERLALGAGYGVQYVDVQPGLSMLFNNPQADLLWAYTDRLHVSLRGGLQIGTVQDDPAAAMQIGPLVAGTLSYASSEKTTLGLGLSHQRQPSYFSGGQLDELTRVSGTVMHHFTERVFAGLEGDFGYNTQISLTANVPSGGSYTFWSVGCMAGYVLTPHMDCCLTYRHLERTANLVTAGFDRNIVSFSLTYRF